ncbi:MAG: YARHG domain-containing protein, partial [Clostridia bacterium]|nr:YARHG domain-containing protein [Clostridia bacterium]
MKTRLPALLLALVLLFALPALALGNDVLVPDSSTRRMTNAECWNWSYEALGFVFHEILARHGFIFDMNGDYGWYFTSQYWYHSIASRDNQEVYDALNNTEWYNINLIKGVRADMRSMGTTNPAGKPAPQRSSYYQHSYSEPRLTSSGFAQIRVNGNLRLAVYSAPSSASWRGANGKAMCNTNGAVYAAGRVGNWVLIAYYLNHGANQGGWRVGYVRYDELTGLRDAIPTLDFLNRTVMIQTRCQLTDDPLGIETPITTLK